MKDRVPLYPGRVKLTPVSGQENTYDMVRADEPTQEGTQLNKASLLKDATAALFGKTNAAVPDDILSLLSKSALAHIVEKYTKTTVGTFAVGKTITLNVSGSPKEFIVVHQGKPSSLYDDSCSGTWLLMKDIYQLRQWNDSDVNKYESSAIHSYLNSTFLNLFDSDIKDAIKQVKLPYRKDGGSGGSDQSGANGLLCKIFLLSGYEVGWTTSDNQYFPQDGAKLSYFESGRDASANNKRIANQNGSAGIWWLRSPTVDNTLTVWEVSSNGDLSTGFASRSYGVRPVLILPSTFVVYTDSSGNIYTEQEYEPKITDVLGNLIAIPADQVKDCVKSATGSYTGTGTYGASNPNSLTFDFVPKLVIVYEPDYGLLPFGTNYWTIGFIWIVNQTATYIKGKQVNFTAIETTLKWISADSDDIQQNRTGAIYNYIALG